MRALARVPTPSTRLAEGHSRDRAMLRQARVEPITGAVRSQAMLRAGRAAKRSTSSRELRVAQSLAVAPHGQGGWPQAGPGCGRTRWASFRFERMRLPASVADVR